MMDDWTPDLSEAYNADPTFRSFKWYRHKPTGNFRMWETTGKPYNNHDTEIEKDYPNFSWDDFHTGYGQVGADSRGNQRLDWRWFGGREGAPPYEADQQIQQGLQQHGVQLPQGLPEATGAVLSPSTANWDAPYGYDNVYPSHGEIPQRLYHVAPRSAREDILANGLDATGRTFNTGGNPDLSDWNQENGMLSNDAYGGEYEWRPEGIYMFNNPDDARQYAGFYDLTARRGNHDIWEINSPGVGHGNIIRDPAKAHNWGWDGDDNAYVTPYVAPQHLRLVDPSEHLASSDWIADSNDSWHGPQYDLTDDQRAPGWQTRVPFILTPGGSLAMGNVGDEHWEIPDNPQQAQELLDHYHEIDPSYTPEDVLHGETWRDHQGQVNFDPDTNEYVAHWPMDWSTMEPKNWITPEMQQRVVTEAQRRWSQRTSSVTASPEHLAASSWKDKYNYRIVDGDNKRACSTCSAFKDGHCAMFYNAKVDERGVCDEWSKTWKPKTAHIEISDDARSELAKFWTDHPDLRDACEKKYGYDPMNEPDKYWPHGLGDEPEHHELLGKIVATGEFTLELAKEWEKQELAAEKREKTSGANGELPEGISFEVVPFNQGYYTIDAKLGPTTIGKLIVHEFSNNTRRIADVHVIPKYRRLGIASAMLAYGQEQLGPISHSNTLTEDGAAWEAADPRYASAPTAPPNYREKEKPNEHCSTCKMMFKGKCWGYGNTPVEPEMVCDSFTPETTKTSSEDWMSDSADSWHGPQSVDKFKVNVPGEAPGMGGIGHEYDSNWFRSPCYCDVGPTTPHEWSPICENGLHPTMEHKAAVLPNEPWNDPMWLEKYQERLDNETGMYGDHVEVANPRIPFVVLEDGRTWIGYDAWSHSYDWMVEDAERELGIDYYEMKDTQGSVNFAGNEYQVNWPLHGLHRELEPQIVTDVVKDIEEQRQRSWEHSKKQSSMTASPTMQHEAGQNGPLPPGMQITEFPGMNFVAWIDDGSGQATNENAIGRLLVDRSRQIHVNTLGQYQRRGVATSLLQYLQQHYPEFVSSHSNLISDEGLAWAQQQQNVMWPQQQTVAPQDGGMYDYTHYASDNSLVQRVRNELTPDLLKPQFKDTPFPGGHCYVATEALYHLMGGPESGYKPMRMRMPDGVTHWWLQGPDGEIIDATHDQFSEPVPYDQGKGGGFLTSHPSNRAREVMRRVQGSWKLARPPAEYGPQFKQEYEGTPDPAAVAPQMWNGRPVRGFDWEINWPAIERLRHLPNWPLKHNINIQTMLPHDKNWQNALGSHDWGGTRHGHNIMLHPFASPEKANETLWHELQHAYQEEEGRMNTEGYDYTYNDPGSGYWKHPVEEDARAFSQHLKDVPLITRAKEHYEPDWLPNEMHLDAGDWDENQERWLLDPFYGMQHLQAQTQQFRNNPREWQSYWQTPEEYEALNYPEVDENDAYYDDMMREAADTSNNWVWLDGDVAFGGEFADIAMKMCQVKHYDDNDCKYISNMIARGLVPEGHNVACGTVRQGYPQIWISTVDRNAVWDDVARELQNDTMHTAGLWPDEQYENAPWNNWDRHLPDDYWDARRPYIVTPDDKVLLGDPGTHHDLIRGYDADEMYGDPRYRRGEIYNGVITPYQLRHETKDVPLVEEALKGENQA